MLNLLTKAAKMSFIHSTYQTTFMHNHTHIIIAFSRYSSSIMI